MTFVRGIAFLALLGMVLSPAWAEVTQVDLVMAGLSCPFCVFNIEKPLKKIQAFESFQTNYKEGIVRAKVNPEGLVDLPQLSQAAAETGFTLKAIRVTAIGTIDHWEGKPVLIVRGTRQRFLLYKEEGEVPSTQGLVQITGIAHEHKDLPPGLAVESSRELNS